MDIPTQKVENTDEKPKRKHRSKFSLRSLRLSLKYRPEIFRLVLKMRLFIQKKTVLVKKLKKQLKKLEKSVQNTHNKSKLNSVADSDLKPVSNEKTVYSSSKSDEPSNNIQKEPVQISKETKTASTKAAEAGWSLRDLEDGKSLADQVKEAAQSALQQSGMVFVESAGMYYDYKTGYYYNPELGLYYHTDTECYYYYNDDKKEFAFHSYPDRSAVPTNPSLEAHEKRKARKQRKAQKNEDEVENLTKDLSKEDQSTKPKRRKKDHKEMKKQNSDDLDNETGDKAKPNDTDDKNKSDDKDTDKPKIYLEAQEPGAIEDKKEEKGDENAELEDGECSDTQSDSAQSSDEESIASTVSMNDDDAIAKHHPPCMRVIVKETNLPKLKVGSLYLVTKDGGTIGREGEQHTILLRDQNVSRSHLDIKYDMERRMYMATDLGSKNGTFLNGVQMSESQVVSLPMEVMHGSTIQLGETKLLCHIHPGNDTCGHCEPGLIMETEEKVKVAYTRTCNVKKQYELELARLKNKYKPEPLMIEDGTYNDRAKARRDTVGSSHHSEKTQMADVDTEIAPDNKGFKLLQKMGWSQGEGLGKDGQGDTAPIPLVSNEGTAGLGAPGSAVAPPMLPLPRVRNSLASATLKLAARSKLLKPPAKAFQVEDDDEEEEV